MTAALSSIRFTNNAAIDNRFNYKEDKAIRHISFYSPLIQTLGYDPLCAVLEVKLAADGKIRRYIGVPEDIWYQLRDNLHPDTYYRRNVCGRFAEVNGLDEEIL